MAKPSRNESAAEVVSSPASTMNNNCAEYDRGKHRAAVRLLLPAARKNLRAAAVVGLIAREYFEAGDTEQAADWFRRVTAMSPKSELASLGLFHSLWKLGSTDEAFAEMQRFLKTADSEEYATLLHDLASAGHLQARLEPVGAA